MNVSDYIKSLDDLSTPVIILDSKGKVVYKNDIAVKCIRLPKRGTHIFIHLDKTGKSEYEKIQKRNIPSVISVNTGDRNARAFVSKYERGGEKCSVWVFMPHLQANASSIIFNYIESSVISASYQICETVKEIDKIGLLPVEKSTKPIDTRISRRLKTLLERIFSEEDFDSSVSLYSLDRTLSILNSASVRTFPNFGFSILMNKSDEILYPGYNLDYKLFSSFYVHMLLFAALSTQNRMINTSFSIEESYLIFKTVFTMPIPPVYAKNEKSVLKMASLCPKNMLDTLILERLCKVGNYAFSFSVSDLLFDNVEISVKVPIYERNIVRSPKPFDIEDLLLEKDETVFMAFLLSMNLSNGEENE